jgi:hypothetical protein
MRVSLTHAKNLAQKNDRENGRDERRRHLKSSGDANARGEPNEARALKRRAFSY